MKKSLSILFFSFLFCTFAFSQEAVKIDEFSNLDCDDYLARVDTAINEAKNNPNSTVYVFLYEGKVKNYNSRKKRTELVFPTLNSVKAKIASMKKRIVSYRRFPIKQFVFIEGGFREDSTVEFWVVPKDARPPKPEPTLQKMKYRKGKAIGFCTECCG